MSTTADIPELVRPEQELDPFLIAIGKLMGGYDPRHIAPADFHAACNHIPAVFFAVVALVHWRGVERQNVLPQGVQIFTDLGWLERNKKALTLVMVERVRQLNKKRLATHPGN